MVNFDLGPKGAVAVKQDDSKCKDLFWVNAQGEWWSEADKEWASPEQFPVTWLQTIAVKDATVEIHWGQGPEGAVAVKQDTSECKDLFWVNSKGEWWSENDQEWVPAERYNVTWLQTIAAEHAA
tara:strand:- start:306 stop:677 length:372 start_codon:yes stop_codon:yes gene_type:complete